MRFWKILKQLTCLQVAKNTIIFCFECDFRKDHSIVSFSLSSTVT